MKKYSLSALNILMIIVVVFATSSCSKKVGCYFSSTPKIETYRIRDLSSATLYPSEGKQNINETVSMIITCN